MTKTEASNYIKGRLKEKSFQETVIDHNWDGYLHGTELRAAFLTLTGLPRSLSVYSATDNSSFRLNLMNFIYYFLYAIFNC